MPSIPVRVCRICQLEKRLSLFPLSKGKRCGFVCMDCGNLRARLNRQKPGYVPVKRIAIPGRSSWSCMMRRCFDRNFADYPYYGGRGIRVCDRWRESFGNFIADMGAPPTKKHTIDRLDNEGHYEPGNCRWATMKEQQNNRRNNVIWTFHGLSLTRCQWADRLGIPAATLQQRLNRGWTLEQTLTIGYKQIMASRVSTRTRIET